MEIKEFVENFSAQFDETDASVFTVSIYIYIDGNDATVNTNNAVNLAMATISLLFSVDAVKAA